MGDDVRGWETMGDDVRGRGLIWEGVVSRKLLPAFEALA